MRRLPATTEFLSLTASLGKLNQEELSAKIDRFIITSDGETEHMHNQLISAIFCNVTRELPDHGVAPWVSTNDKPATGAGSKPVSGDALEQRLKTEVMQLPSRDRRRIKDVALNEVSHLHERKCCPGTIHANCYIQADPFDAFASMLIDPRKSKAKAPEFTAAGAAGLNKTNWDLEIRKRYTQPLAGESMEFPDTSAIQKKLLPICYEHELTAGHTPDAAQFISVAAETWIKEHLSDVFAKTRCNGPGALGSAGSGGAAGWITTYKYRKQLEQEEDAFLRGEIQRDKNGLLPIEARAASERGPLGLADYTTALELGDCGIGQMPTISAQIIMGHREGELEAFEDYSYVPSHKRPKRNHLNDRDGDAVMLDVAGPAAPNGKPMTNGEAHMEDLGWEGVDGEAQDSFDSLLSDCLAA